MIVSRIALRPFCVIAGVCLGLHVILAAGPAGAEPVFSFATTPGELPKTVVPLHYSLDLTPDLDKLSFTGSAIADIDVNEPVERLVLNAVDLAFENAAIDGEPLPAAALAIDAAAE